MSAKIVPLTALLGKVSTLWERGLPPGFSTGWKTLDPFYTVAPGQLTIVTGWPGSGKSEWLDALLVNLSRQGWRFAVFSFENQPVELHAAKLLEKMDGRPFGAGPTERIAKDKLPELTTDLSQTFGMFQTASGGTDVDSILNAATSWFDAYAGDHAGLVIDPWNELEHRRPNNLSETEYVSQTLSVIRQWARDSKVHVWIVAHPQKMRKEDGRLPIPRPDMISGCHDDKTEVLTTRGWVRHSEVTLFDHVCCFDPESGRLVYRRPSVVHEYDHDGEMHHWTSPSYDAMVTPNHRMLVRPNWHRKPSFSARYSGSGLGRPVVYAVDGWTFIESRDVRSDLEMPWATQLMDCEDSSLFTDAQLRFLGYWISEGWAHKRGGIGVCQAAGTVADMMRATLEEMGCRFTDRVDGPGARGNLSMWKAYLWKSEFTEWVKENCGVGAANKKIPAGVWAASRRQKEILFRALMDGDGHWFARGGGIYTTISRELADQVQRLSIELGRMASVRARPAKGNNRECFVVMIGEGDRDHISIRPSRNLEKSTYRGRVYCLTVPTGAYLIRRNGKPGIYGNSQHWWNKADCCVTVWRDMEQQTQDVDIYVQKVRFKHIGRQGLVTLAYDRVTGRYHDKWDGLTRVV